MGKVIQFPNKFREYTPQFHETPLPRDQVPGKLTRDELLRCCNGLLREHELREMSHDGLVEYNIMLYRRGLPAVRCLPNKKDTPADSD